MKHGPCWAKHETEPELVPVPVPGQPELALVPEHVPERELERELALVPVPEGVLLEHWPVPGSAEEG